MRSLAVLRIGLGLLLLSDLALRSRDFVAHYTDQGVLPRSALSYHQALSLYLVDGSFWYCAVLFGLAAIFAGALLIGWCTRLATLASLYFLIELHVRNPMITHGGDNLLRVMLFWSLFLPLGAKYSIDSITWPRSRKLGPSVASMATIAFILQVCFVYWFTAALKSDPAWRIEGTAVYYALSIDQFTTILGQSLLEYPQLLRVLTHATFWLEALGPLLLFLPFFQGVVRTVVIFAFVGFHLFGLGLTLELGNFPFVCSLAWLALLPGWFWSRISRLAPKSVAAYVVAESTGPAARAKRILGSPWWLEAIVGAFLIYVLLWNVRSLGDSRFANVIPRKMDWVGMTVGLDQNWSLFAPCPLKDDGWFVIVGTLENGEQVDLIHSGAPVSWKKPALVSATLKNARWRRYLMNIWQKEHARHRHYFADYLQRDWNSRHAKGKRLQNLEIYYMLEFTRPNYQWSRPAKVLLYQS